MVIYSKVTEAPEIEPVTLEEAKSHLHIELDYTDEDALIISLIRTARRLCESYSGRSFMTQERVIKMDRFPSCEYYNRSRLPNGITVPYGPIQTIDAVKYIDSDGNEQTMDAADYKADLHSDLARIFPTDTWPSTSNEPNAVSVEYTAGFDAVSGGTEEFPEEIRQAMLMQIGTLYENRQDEVLATSVNKMNWTSKALLDPYKVYWNAAQD